MHCGQYELRAIFASGRSPLTEEQIDRIRDRLVAEIPSDNFTRSLFLFGLADPKDDEMQPGQSLLAE